jgi:uncharacterized protein (TIGR00369 family)
MKLDGYQGEIMDNCDEELFSVINEMFSEKIPFNKVLGLKVESINPERVKVSFETRDELIGHYTRGTLHGGVISSVIDVTGGLSAFMSIQERFPGELLEERLAKFARVSTIDLRVDFLRPGLGKCFVATAYTLRTGNRVAVTRIELHNDQNDLIAVGTGSYVVA